MSATNRGTIRHTYDAYMTPGWVARRLLEELRRSHPNNAQPATILDPGAGNGALLKVAKEFYPNSALSAIEIRQECKDALAQVTSDITIADYLASNWPHADLTIMNPPYSLALDFVQKALTHSDWVIALLRICWLSSGKRHEFLKNHMPNVYVLPNRPSFTINTGGGTDQTEYAWMTWDAHSCCSDGAIKTLELTSLEKRSE